MKDLREYIEKVREFGELKIIEGAKWDLEIGAITYLAAKNPEPPALLFDKVEGYKKGFRIFAIPFTTDKRTALLLGQPQGLSRLEMVKRLRDKMAEPLKLVPPVEVKDGPVLENVYTGDKVDLNMFPTPKWQAGDGGRYIGTGDNVITKDPDEGWVNVGVHRIQVHDKTTATIFFEQGRHGDLIRKKYWSKGKACPVAVTCGGDPLHIFLGGAPVPWGTPKYDYMGWWKKEPIEVIKGPLTGLPIPAHAEIVLEGEMVPPEVESREEGPFSEFTGHFSPSRPEAAFRVKSILHRNDPIMLAVLPYLGPGIIPMAWNLVIAGQVWQELDRAIPGVKGVWSELAFGNRGSIVISLQQKYSGHSRQAGLIALGYVGYMEKFVIVVDDDVDPSNLNEVLYTIGMRTDPETSFEIIRGCRSGFLDPRLTPEKRASGNFTSSAVIIDACKPYHWLKDFPALIKTDPRFAAQVKEKWGDKLV